MTFICAVLHIVVWGTTLKMGKDEFVRLAISHNQLMVAYLPLFDELCMFQYMCTYQANIPVLHPNVHVQLLTDVAIFCQTSGQSD